VKAHRDPHVLIHADGFEIQIFECISGTRLSPFSQFLDRIQAHEPVTVLQCLDQAIGGFRLLQFAQFFNNLSAHIGIRIG